MTSRSCGRNTGLLDLASSEMASTRLKRAPGLRGRTAKVFVYYRSLKKVKSMPAHYVPGSVARPVDGIFTAQLNCPRTWTLLPLKS